MADGHAAAAGSDSALPSEAWLGHGAVEEGGKREAEALDELESTSPGFTAEELAAWEAAEGSAAKTQSRLLRALDKQALSLRNRLLSIVEDSAFVQEEAERLQLPVLANLRNGAWYCRQPLTTAYFKSTDGHSGRWAFPISRLNAHVARLASQHGGVLLVDSTRRGKRFPDALARTVPIWCAVVNAALFGEGDWLHLPSWLPPSEAHEIGKLLPAFLATLREQAAAVLPSLQRDVNKPLRCLWSCPGDRLWRDGRPAGDELPFVPIVCLSASSSASAELHRERHSWHYVQGAGDDEENWALGMTARQFWSAAPSLLALDSDVALRAAVSALAATSTAVSTAATAATAGEDGSASAGRAASSALTAVADAPLAFGRSAELTESDVLAAAAVLDLSPKGREEWKGDAMPSYHHVAVLSGKRRNSGTLWTGSVFPLVRELLQAAAAGEGKLVIVCQDGCSASVIAIIAALLFAQLAACHADGVDEDAAARARAAFRRGAKKAARAQLLRVQQLQPEARPPRRWMKQLNVYFTS